MRAVGTLTDPAAPDKIKMPHWDILILSWLTIVNEFRTTYYNDIMNIATHLELIKNLFNQLDFKRNTEEKNHFVYKNNKQNYSTKPVFLLS